MNNFISSIKINTLNLSSNIILIKANDNDIKNKSIINESNNETIDKNISIKNKKTTDLSITDNIYSTKYNILNREIKSNYLNSVNIISQNISKSDNNIIKPNEATINYLPKNIPMIKSTIINNKKNLTINDIQNLNDIKYNKTKINDNSNELINTSYSNSTISNNNLYSKNISDQKINKDFYLLIIGICLPIILIILILLLIYYFIKRKKKSQSDPFNHNNLNKVKFNLASKLSYKKIQNTSNLNIINNNNNMSMSEIKMQNFKSELNNSSNSFSSGKRKREKNKNNDIRIENKNQKEIQNEIKEQIKQIVIDENSNDY